MRILSPIRMFSPNFLVRISMEVSRQTVTLRDTPASNANHRALHPEAALDPWRAMKRLSDGEAGAIEKDLLVRSCFER